MSEEFTVNDLFILFDKPLEGVRWIGSADSEEYLAVVTLLVQRNNRETAA